MPNAFLNMVYNFYILGAGDGDFYKIAGKQLWLHQKFPSDIVSLNWQLSVGLWQYIFWHGSS
jgi:hypothetical protein